MEYFSGSIQYNETSLRKMDTTLQDTFFVWKRAVMLAFCAALLAFSIHLGLKTAGGLICCFAACMMAPYAIGKHMPSYIARQSIKVIRGKYLIMTYGFKAAEFVCRIEGAETIYRYDRIQYLVEDEENLYLCLSKVQGCMVEKKSLHPDSVEKCKAFLSQQTKKQWMAPKSVLSMTLSGFRRKPSAPDPTEELRRKLRR